MAVTAANTADRHVIDELLDQPAPIATPVSLPPTPAMAAVAVQINGLRPNTE
jgi:hypothetical protein